MFLFLRNLCLFVHYKNESEKYAVQMLQAVGKNSEVNHLYRQRQGFYENQFKFLIGWRNKKCLYLKHFLLQIKTTPLMDSLTIIFISIAITSAVSGGALLYGMFLDEDDITTQRATIYASSIAMILNAIVILLTLFFSKW